MHIIHSAHGSHSRSQRPRTVVVEGLTGQPTAVPRILLLVDSYLPGTKSGGKMMHDLANELARQGCEVCVACPDADIKQATTITREGKVLVLRVRTGKIKGASKVLRAIEEIRLSGVMWRAAKDFFVKQPHDLIVSYSPTIFFGGLVQRLKKLWACPNYLILRDIFPQWAVDAGVLSKGLAYWYFRWVERRLYAVADVIGVQSPGNLEYFRQEKLESQLNLEVLFNWTVLNEPCVPETAYREKFELTGKTVFFYGGNMGVAQDMQNIVRLADACRHRPDVAFLLVGEGSEVPRIQADIRERRLTNISVRPAVSQAEYVGMLSEFDVGLVSLDRKLKTQNIPGKILGYLYHGLPTLASLNSGNDLFDLFVSRNAGLAVQNGDDDGLAAAALRLADDAALRRQIGINGRRLLEDVFSVERAAGQILRQLPSVRRTGQQQGYENARASQQVSVKN